MTKKKPWVSIIGKTVIVEPELSSPMSRWDFVTVIDAGSGDHLFVETDDKIRKVLSSKSLYILRPTLQLITCLAANCHYLSASLQRSILQVAKLMMENRYREALSRAMIGKETSSYCIVRCDEWIRVVSQ